jgi:hypothetical protein
MDASPNGLTVAEVARPDGADRMHVKPFKSLFQKLGWAFLLFEGSQSQ